MPDPSIAITICERLKNVTILSKSHMSSFCNVKRVIPSEVFQPIVTSEIDVILQYKRCHNSALKDN